MDDDAAEEWVDPAAARRAGVLASSSLAYAVSMSDDAVVESRARVLASFMVMLFQLRGKIMNAVSFNFEQK